MPEYEGKINCIYIDPPYNTGNEDWVYNDNVNDPKIKKWLGQVVGKESEDLSRHDKWLCMMYPRLKLLHQLLADDGAIFISIDDNEQANLKLICDEIFGKNNFLAQLVWNTEGNTDNQLDIKINHEYVFLYVKRRSKKNKAIGNVVDPNTRSDSNLWKGIVDNNINKNNPANPPDCIELPTGFPSSEERLVYKQKTLDNDFFKITREEKYISDAVKLKYSIEHKSGLPIKIDDMVVQNYQLIKSCRIYGGFANGEKLKRFINNDCQPIIDGETTISFYINKNAAVRYRKDASNSKNILSVLRNFGTTEKTKTKLKGMGFYFSYPKPIELIQYLLSIGGSDKNAIILDSFAGSGTTAHAVLNLNKADGGNRQFILIEMEDYAEDITAERVRRVINGYGEGKKAVEGTGGSFTFYELGEPLFLDNQMLNEVVSTDKIREYIWYSETHCPFEPPQENYLLGVKNDTAYYFYYEKLQLTTLDERFLRTLATKAEQYIIYADNCLLDKAIMTKYGIVFKKIPRDISRF